MITFLKRLWSWLLAFFWKSAPAAVKEAPRPTDICFGVDFGGTYDNTVVAIIERSTLTVLDVVMVPHCIDWKTQQDQLLQLAHHWQPALMLGDANGLGGAYIEALQMTSVPIRPFTITHQSKIMLTSLLDEALRNRSLKVERRFINQDNTALALALYAATAYPKQRINPYV